MCWNGTDTLFLLHKIRLSLLNTQRTCELCKWDGCLLALHTWLLALAALLNSHPSHSKALHGHAADRANVHLSTSETTHLVSCQGTCKFEIHAFHLEVVPALEEKLLIRVHEAVCLEEVDFTVAVQASDHVVQHSGTADALAPGT